MTQNRMWLVEFFEVFDFLGCKLDLHCRDGLVELFQLAGADDGCSLYFLFQLANDRFYQVRGSF